MTSIIEFELPVKLRHSNLLLNLICPEILGIIERNANIRCVNKSFPFFVRDGATNTVRVFNGYICHNQSLFICQQFHTNTLVDFFRIINFWNRENVEI